MSRILTTELFVPTGELTTENVTLVVRGLLQTGFVFEPEPDRGGHYWANENLHGPSSLPEALTALDSAANWGITLWPRMVTGELTDVFLSVDKVVADQRSRFAKVGLSMNMLAVESRPVLARLYLAWATFVSELVHPWYGWGGSELGLFNRETTPVSPTSIAALDLQPVEWLNIYGPPYVARLGLERLLEAPAWRAELLADGSVGVTLAPHPQAVPAATARAVTRYLGIGEPSA